jgi:hypothetical protein
MASEHRPRSAAPARHCIWGAMKARWSIIVMNPFPYAIKIDVRRARAGSGRMRTLSFLQFFFRRMFMSFPKKRRRASAQSEESFLAVLRQFKPFGQLDTKIARARAQDEPVLYAHVLPGLDVLLCSVRGAQPPYPAVDELHRRCIESISNALEQPLDGLENGGYWYEANGFGFLVFASRARSRILPEFGAGMATRGARRQNAGDATPRSLR